MTGPKTHRIPPKLFLVKKCADKNSRCYRFFQFYNLSCQTSHCQNLGIVPKEIREEKGDFSLSWQVIQALTVFLHFKERYISQLLNFISILQYTLNLHVFNNRGCASFVIGARLNGVNVG